jgi:hypothetical protein
MAQDGTGRQRRLWTVAAVQGSGSYGWRGGGCVEQRQLWMAQQQRKTARRQHRNARQRQGGKAAAAWRGGARGHGMVIDGGGAMRTV